MQTVTAPSRSSVLGSLKNSFAVNGVSSNISAQVPTANNQAPNTSSQVQGTMDNGPVVQVANVPSQVPSTMDQGLANEVPTEPKHLPLTTNQVPSTQAPTSNIQVPMQPAIANPIPVTSPQDSVVQAPTPNNQVPIVPGQGPVAQSMVASQVPSTTDQGLADEITLSDDEKTHIFENVLQDIEAKAEVEAQSLFNTASTPNNQVPTEPKHLPLTTNQVPSTQVPINNFQAPSVGSQVVNPMAQPPISQVPITNKQALNTLSQGQGTTDQGPVVQVANVPGQVPSTMDQGLVDDPAANTATMGQVAVTLDTTPVSTLNPPIATPAAHKESLGGSTLAVEANAGGGTVEAEPFKEIPPEVESYIQKVESHDQLPQEIAIANGDVTLTPVQYPAQPVIVLPITAQVDEEAAKKGPEFSVRWLKEFCGKVINMFAGKVVYKNQE